MKIKAVKHEAGFSVKIIIIFKFHSFSRKSNVFYNSFLIVIMKGHCECFCLLNCLSVYSICVKKMCFTFYEENLICVKTEQTPRLLYAQLNNPNLFKILS